MENNEKPDYEIAQEELNALYANKIPQARILGGELRKKDKWEYKAYTVIIDNVSFEWKQGTGIKGKPNAAEVLARCCADYLSSKTDFPEWCLDFGYDSDSIKARKVYDDCQELGTQLRKIVAIKMDNSLLVKFAELANRL